MRTPRPALVPETEMGIVCPSTILGASMNENAVHLKDLIKGAGLTRDAAAMLLYVSLDTIHKWLKPATTAQKNPCPPWAVELLAFKTNQEIPSVKRLPDRPVQADIETNFLALRSQGESMAAAAKRLGISVGRAKRIDQIASRPLEATAAEVSTPKPRAKRKAARPAPSARKKASKSGAPT